MAKLKARLQAQPLDLWNYSNEGEEIPGGVRVVEYLQERVVQAQLFIPLVTMHSVRSVYTQAEVACALELWKQGSLRIIPLVYREMTAENVDWGPVYEQLKEIRYFEVSLVRRADWEQAIARICQSLGIEYRALPTEDPRLPFMDRFDQELNESRMRDEERHDSVYIRLGHVRTQFVVAFENGDYSVALRLIDFFLGTCDCEFEDRGFLLYPAIAKVVCLIALGRYPEALDLAFSLNPTERNDETLFGMVGYIHQQQGAYGEAARYYQRALDLDPSDPAAASGVVVNKTLLNDISGLDAVLQILSSGTFYTEEDRQRAQVIQAHALAVCGRVMEAVDLFETLSSQGIDDPNLYINFARSLVDSRRVVDAVRILKLGIEVCQNPLEIYKWKMQLHLMCEVFLEALATMREALEHYPENRELQHYLQICFVKSGLLHEARTAAAEFLAGLQPVGNNEFYYAGFANWLLDRQELARYDFERSGRDQSEFYSNLINV